jgi:hypothetical protein
MDGHRADHPTHEGAGQHAAEQEGPEVAAAAQIRVRGEPAEQGGADEGLGGVGEGEPQGSDRADALGHVDGHLDERRRGQDPRPPAPVAEHQRGEGDPGRQE